jgi:TPR repeat protein
MYDKGEGVPEDDKEAMKWYRLAAEQGYASAQSNLGVMYNCLMSTILSGRAKIYVFYTFLTMTPPSLWEAIAGNSRQFEQLEERFLELERREADILLRSGK